MAPDHSSSDPESSDDEGAPEIISLSQSKKDIQKLDAELKKAEIAERQSKRRQNREMDRKLKERAGMNRSSKKKGDDADELLEARMQRAMQEAQEEMDENGESGSGAGDLDSDNSDKDEEDVGSLDDEQDSEEEEQETKILPPKLKKKISNPDHLPDELFTAAFAAQASSSSKRKFTEDEEDQPLKQTPKKRKKPSRTQKDLIVGSKAIRMLPTPGQPITPSAAPSSKVKKFLNRSLALKGGKQRSKTWERRPANIGVLRRDGPASNFVRNR